MFVTQNSDKHIQVWEYSLIKREKLERVCVYLRKSLPSWSFMISGHKEPAPNMKFHNQLVLTRSKSARPVLGGLGKSLRVLMEKTCMQEQRHRQTESVQTHYQPEVTISREPQVSRPGGPAYTLSAKTWRVLWLEILQREITSADGMVMNATILIGQLSSFSVIKWINYFYSGIPSAEVIYDKLPWLKSYYWGARLLASPLSFSEGLD